MSREPRAGRPFDVREIEPSSEAVRRLLLCIHARGGQQVVADWLDVAPNTLHQYIQGKRLPTLALAVQIQRRSRGLVPVEAWLDAPRGAWPPQNLTRAHERLLTAG